MCAVRCCKISFTSRAKKSSTILSKRVTPIKIKNKFEFRLRLCKSKIESGRAVIRLCSHKPLFRRGWFYAPLNQYNVGIESGGMKMEMKIFRGEENFPHRAPGGRERAWNLELDKSAWNLAERANCRSIHSLPKKCLAPKIRFVSKNAWVNPGNPQSKQSPRLLLKVCLVSVEIF